MDPIENLLLDAHAFGIFWPCKGYGNDNARKREDSDAVQQVDSIQRLVEGLHRDALMAGRLQHQNLAAHQLEVTEVTGSNS
jgi:hypothetical protein